jgi:hypothetical protein
MAEGRCEGPAPTSKNNLAVLLLGFIGAAADKPCRSGAHDCGLLCCDWIELLTDRDPAAALRGRYHDAASLRAVAGDWPLTFDRLMRAAGLVRTDTPRLGDVAIVMAHDNRLRAVIATAQGFVTVAEQGLWGMRGEARLVRAWTLS